MAKKAQKDLGGRPRLDDKQQSVTLSFVGTAKMREALKKAAKARGCKVSDIIREAIEMQIGNYR